MKFIFTVLISAALLAILPTGSDASDTEFNCRKFIFHPKCRGLTAKRSNIPGSSASIIDFDSRPPGSDTHRQLTGPGFSDYSELEREDTPEELDISRNRRRFVPQPEGPAPAPLPVPSFPSSPRPRPVLVPTLPRREHSWNDNTISQIPPQHSTFQMGRRRSDAGNSLPQPLPVSSQPRPHLGGASFRSQDHTASRSLNVHHNSVPFPLFRRPGRGRAEGHFRSRA